MICIPPLILFGLSNQEEKYRQSILAYMGERRGAV
jgi:hypothetical protein